MKNNKDWVPVVGMCAKDCYVSVLTDISLLGKSGKITYVGKNYFLLRIDSTGQNVVIKEQYYNIIKKIFDE